MVASNSLTVRGDILDGSWPVERSVISLTVIEGISSMGPTLNPTIRTGGTLWVVVLEVRWVNQTTNLSERVLSKQQHQTRTTVNNGYLGSRNDEERSEMRYVMRIAELRESSNF